MLLNQYQELREERLSHETKRKQASAALASSWCDGRRQRRFAVVFHLHNFGHSEPKGSGSENDRRAFAYVSAVIFPSECSRSHYARRLGPDGPVIPDPIALDRIVSADPEPKYVTFINSSPQMRQGFRTDRHCGPPRATRPTAPNRTDAAV